MPRSSRIWVTASRERRLDDPAPSRAASASRSQHPARGGRLDADDRHVVGDDVVQLARDAQPLLDDGLPLQARGLGVDGAGLLGETVPLAGPLRHAAWPPMMAPPK